MKGEPAPAFDIVRRMGLTFPDVTVATKYDGSPVLRMRGVFMAGLACHPSSEPDTLVVRYPMEQRQALVEEAPEVYYLTGYYRRHPVVLARLTQLTEDALRDLLTVSWRLSSTKVRKTGSARRLDGESRRRRSGANGAVRYIG